MSVKALAFQQQSLPTKVPKQSVNRTPAAASLLLPETAATSQKIASDEATAPISRSQMKAVDVESPRALAGSATA
jgi:hypothetical protein